MSQHAALYDRKWRNARARFLQAHPLCVLCERRDEITPATVVNHRIPHRGDQTLFWARSNWQAVCAPCHDSDIQRSERGGDGLIRGHELDGTPTDPMHPWNATPDR